MDSKTTIAQLKKKIDRIEKSRGWSTVPKDLAVSISIEAAELLEHFQWGATTNLVEKIQISPQKFEELELEVADVAIYLGNFADKMGIDISNAVNKKIKKIEEKYPADKIKKHGDEFYYQQKRKYRGK